MKQDQHDARSHKGVPAQKGAGGGASELAPAFKAQPAGASILGRERSIISGRGGAGGMACGVESEASSGARNWRSIEPRPLNHRRAGAWGGGRPQVQARGGPSLNGAAAQAIAADGVSSSGGPLPHLEAIQTSFGHHDVRGIRAHTDKAAETANAGLGSKAYATGSDVALASTDLHTAAHEAAHVVQQRGGIQLKEGVGTPGDVWERHADAVADRVVAGESAEPLLDEVKGGAPTQGLQMKTIGFEFQASNTHFYHKTKDAEEGGKPTYSLAQHNHALYAQEEGLFKIESDGIEFELVTKPFEVEQLGEKFAAIKTKVQALESDTASTAFKKIGRSGKEEDAKDATENLGTSPLPLQPDGKPTFLGINDGQKIKAHPQATFGAPIEELPGLYQKISEGPEKWDELKVTDARAYVGGIKGAGSGSDGVDGFLALVASIIVTGEKAKAGTFHKDLAPLMPRTSLATIFSSLSADDKALCTVENLRKAIGRRGGGMDLTARLHDPDRSNHELNDYSRQNFFEDIVAGKVTRLESGSFGALKDGQLGDMEGLSGPMDIGGGQKGVWLEHRRLQRGVKVDDWGDVAAQVAGDLKAAHESYEASKKEQVAKPKPKSLGPSKDALIKVQDRKLVTGRKELADALAMKASPKNAGQAKAAEGKIAQAKLKIAKAKTELVRLGVEVTDEETD